MRCGGVAGRESLGADGPVMELWRWRGGDSGGAWVVVDSVSAMLCCGVTCGGPVEMNTRWKNSEFGPKMKVREK